MKANINVITQAGQQFAGFPALAELESDNPPVISLYINTVQVSCKELNFKYTINPGDKISIEIMA